MPGKSYFKAGGLTWTKCRLIYEFLRHMARRIAGGEGPHPAYHVAEEFVNDAPQGLDRLYQLVPDKNVKNYQESTLDRMISTVGDYLP